MVQEHSSPLVWQIVKGWNSHIVKGLNGTNRKGGGIILSKEPGNLYNKHSYKYSGLQGKAMRAWASFSLQPLCPCCRHLQRQHPVRQAAMPVVVPISAPAAGIYNDEAVVMEQPCCLHKPYLTSQSCSVYCRPLQAQDIAHWAVLPSACICASHHGYAVPAAGIVPTSLCPCNSLAVCSTHASQHGHTVPAAGICSNKCRADRAAPLLSASIHA